MFHNVFEMLLCLVKNKTKKPDTCNDDNSIVCLLPVSMHTCFCSGAWNGSSNSHCNSSQMRTDKKTLLVVWFRHKLTETDLFNVDQTKATLDIPSVQVVWTTCFYCYIEVHCPWIRRFILASFILSIGPEVDIILYVVFVNKYFLWDVQDILLIIHQFFWKSTGNWWVSLPC